MNYASFYGRYKNVRDASWKLMLDHTVSRLPVSTVGIALEIGINVISYNDGCKFLKEMEMSVLCEKTSGFTLKHKNSWFIFYDDTVVSQQCIRFTIAHELAHILLGHKPKFLAAKVGENLSMKKNIEVLLGDPLEHEADIFASRLLAPAIVLRGLNIYKAEEIRRLCDLPRHASEARSKRMEQLLAREKERIEMGLDSNFGLHILEKMVAEQFRGFIESSNKV